MDRVSNVFLQFMRATISCKYCVFSKLLLGDSRFFKNVVLNKVAHSVQRLTIFVCLQFVHCCMKKNHLC